MWPYPTPDWTPWMIFIASAVIVPVGGWLVRSSISLDRRFTSHEAVDEARFEGIRDALKRIEEHQKDNGDKLDRAIERLPAKTQW